MANSVDPDQTAPIGAVSVLGSHCLLLYQICQYYGRQLFASDLFSRQHFQMHLFSFGALNVPYILK